MNAGRALLAAFLIVTMTIVVTGRRVRPVAEPAFASLPYVIGDWRGADAEPLDEESRTILGADQYLLRTYQGVDGAAAGLYVAYYATQKPGVSIHSPLHCLPGTGWEPLDTSGARVETAAGSVQVNRLLARKNLDQALVLYWYQLEDRMIASDVMSRIYLAGRGMIGGRSDAALVRIVVPVAGSEAAADIVARRFARDLIPVLQTALHTALRRM